MLFLANFRYNRSIKYKGSPYEKDIELLKALNSNRLWTLEENWFVDDDLELYGKYKAKLSFDKIREVEKNTVGKLILSHCDQPDSS